MVSILNKKLTCVCLKHIPRWGFKNQRPLGEQFLMHSNKFKVLEDEKEDSYFYDIFRENISNVKILCSELQCSCTKWTVPKQLKLF